MKNNYNITAEKEHDDLMESEIEIFTAEENDKNKRLDVFLSERFSDMSRSYIQKIIKEEGVLVNSKKQKPGYKISEGDNIEISVPEPEELKVEPQNISIDIIYEDDDLLVVNKPQGMVVHPAPGNPNNTLVNAILYHCKGKLSSINGVIRPGIVHRIDKNTSGILVIAKNDRAHNGLAEQFKVHSITREYQMICAGNVDWETKTVDTHIGRNPKDRLKMAVVKEGGKRAITHLSLIENLDGYSHIKACLETGRTHQIRVHTSFLRHPIIGDEVYGYRMKRFSNLKGQMLHAKKLGFVHPVKNIYMEFDSPLPEYFVKTLNDLKRGV